MRAGLILIWLACVLGALATLIRMLWCVGANPDKALGIAVALDRAGNVAANGGLAETISSRAERARREGQRWGCWLCGLLDRIDPDNCKNAAGQ